MTLKEPIQPRFQSPAFICPGCGIYAKQHWYYHVSGTFDFMGQGGSTGEIAGLAISKCEHCGACAVWLQEKIVFPETSTAPKAHEDMPGNAEEFFNEARMALDRSPRAAAALLRLTADHLCDELGAKGENLNQKIGNLVQMGLPREVQEAFDGIRGFGNDALHPPGEIFEKDDRNTALLLFDLLNLIVEKTITDKKTIKRIYSRLPEGVKNGIKRRDGIQDEEQ